MDGAMVGDVVLTPFPFTDLTGTKIRPAVVVADVGMKDWIVCEITSSPQMRPRYIGISDSDFQIGRLRVASWARPDRLTTLNERVFIRPLGRLTPSKQAEIAAAIRALF